MNSYDELKAERNRLKALIDAQPKSRQHIPAYQETVSKYKRVQNSISNIFREKHNGNSNIR